MDSRLPDASSGTPGTQGQDRDARQPERQQLPSLFPRIPESNTTIAPDGTNLNQTISRHDLLSITNDMYRHRSSTPPGGSTSGSVKYTRTGRVSKAAKGQRIHHCGIDGCDKVFSRAEHLRRHQQNHRPGTFRCDMPNCEKSFHREDLLMRHKARHNELLDDPHRRQSVGSQSSAPDAGSLFMFSTTTPQATASGTSATASAPHRTDSGNDAAPSDHSRAPKRLPVPPNELHIGRLPIEISGPYTGLAHNPWSSPTQDPLSIYDYDSSDEAFGHASAAHAPNLANSGHSLSRSTTPDSSSSEHYDWRACATVVTANYPGLLSACIQDTAGSNSAEEQVDTFSAGEELAREQQCSFGRDWKFSFKAWKGGVVLIRFEER